MKETSKRRITVTSSSNEIFPEQIENGGGGVGHPLSTTASGQIFKDDENICPPPRILSVTFCRGLLEKVF